MTEKVLMNPFPGLRAFEEEEDVLFFGREKQIDELLRKLRTSRFLAIIGSSGSGKSSLVKSGLLPSLHSGLMSGVGSQWRIALFRPGNDPIGQMNLALSQNGVLRDEQTKDELDTNTAINGAILNRSNLGLIEVYKQSGLDKRNNLLVLVDQFEELFRFSKYEKDIGEGKRDSIAFINLLLRASEQKEYPIYVVFTMRSDFLGDCTEFRGLPEAINEGQYLVPRMTREERREAITGPIAVGGAKITPALVTRLLNDVGDNPDQLPILQHALMRTWDVWTKKHHPEEPIDIDDYETIGTISEALSQHAEEAFAELATDRERQICEVVFKELTDKGGLSNGIRRPRLLSELCATADATEAEVIKVIETFRKPGRGFLMPAYPVPLTSKSIIDISHESIMRVWKRLMTWLEEEEEAAQVYLHLCEAVNLYESGKGGLWRDPELQIAIKWKDEHNKNAAWAARYNNYYEKVIFFLEHSRQQRDLELKHKEEMQKQRLRITRRVSVVVSVIALIALVLALYSFQQKKAADKAQDEAVVEKDKAEVARKHADSLRDKAIVLKDLADAATIRAKKSADTAEIRKNEALKEKATAEREQIRATKAERDARNSEADARHNAKVAKENQDKAEESQREADAQREIALNEKTRAEKGEKLAESKNIAHRALMFMNNGQLDSCKRLARLAYENNSSNGGNFQDNDIYNALYMGWRFSNNSNNFFSRHKAPVRAITGISPNVVFSGDENGVVIISRSENGILKENYRKKVGGEVRALVTDPSGTYLLAVLLSEAVLYRVSDGSELSRVRISGNGKHGVFLNNKNFVVQSTAGVWLFDVNNPKAKTDSVNIANCTAIAVGAGGKIFISASKRIDEYASWDAVHNQKSQRFDLPYTVTSLAVDQSGKYLAAGTEQGSIWFKELGNGGDGKISPGIHKSSVNDIKFSTLKNGHQLLASAGSDKTVKVTDVSGGRLNVSTIIALSDHSKWVYALYYSQDGNYLYSGGEDQVVVGRPSTMDFIYNEVPKNK